MEHAARFLVGVRQTFALDVVRRVRRVPCVEVGDVGRRPVLVDAQDGGQVVGQPMRAAAHFDQHIQLVTDEGDVGGSKTAATIVPGARQVRGNRLLRAVGQHPGHATAVAGFVRAENVEILGADILVSRLQIAPSAGLGHVEVAVRAECEATRVGEARRVLRPGRPGGRGLAAAGSSEGVRLEGAGARTGERGEDGCGEPSKAIHDLVSPALLLTTCAIRAAWWAARTARSRRPRRHGRRACPGSAPKRRPRTRSGQRTPSGCGRCRRSGRTAAGPSS